MWCISTCNVDLSAGSWRTCVVYKYTVTLICLQVVGGLVWCISTCNVDLSAGSWRTCVVYKYV